MPKPPLLRPITGAARRAGFKIAGTSTGPRRKLLAEMVGAATIITIAELSQENAKAPKAQAYMAAFVVYLGLSFLSDAGPEQAKLAVAFGGLVLLGIAITHAAVFLTASEAIERPIIGPAEGAIQSA